MHPRFLSKNIFSFCCRYADYLYICLSLLNFNPHDMGTTKELSKTATKTDHGTMTTTTALLVRDGHSLLVTTCTYVSNSGQSMSMTQYLV